jgi:hypothetical protein
VTPPAKSSSGGFGNYLSFLTERRPRRFRTTRLSDDLPPPTTSSRPREQSSNIFLRYDPKSKFQRRPIASTGDSWADVKRRQRGRDFRSLVVLWLLVAAFVGGLGLSSALGMTDLILTAPAAFVSSLFSSLSPSHSFTSGSHGENQVTPVLAPERDTLVLYRILGNDLPPRHSPHQTLNNIRFMLSHESKFPPRVLYPRYPTAERPLRVEKYYVLNRVSSQEHTDAIVRVLTEFGVAGDHILKIPFDWEDFERARFRWDGGVKDGNGSTRENLWGIGRPSGKSVRATHFFHFF